MSAEHDVATCRRKVRYPTMPPALTARDFLLAKNGSWTQVYTCRVCGGFHLGTPRSQRISWRILKDWIEAQLALIETEMVSLDQVLLPYMTTDTGHSVYEVLVERRFALPALGTGEQEIEDEEVLDGEIVGGAGR